MSHTDSGETDSAAIPAERAGLSPPYTYEELVDADPVGGGLAFDPESKRPYLVLEERPERADEHEVDPGGVLTEWVDCDPDESVYVGVSVEVLRNKTEEWRGLDHIRRAVDSGRIAPRSIPESSLAPLPAELADEVIR